MESFVWASILYSYVKIVLFTEFVRTLQIGSVLEWGLELDGRGFNWVRMTTLDHEITLSENMFWALKRDKGR